MNKKYNKAKKLKQLYNKLASYVEGSKLYNDTAQKINTIEKTAKK